MLDAFLKKKMIFLTGKGGTGKSFLTCYLGLQASKLKKRVLLVESSQFEEISAVFGQEPVGHVETKVTDYLSIINLDPKICFKEYVSEHLGLQSLYRRVFSKKVVKSFLDAIPGLNEVMFLGRLYYTAELYKPSYDLIVVDAKAFGHFYQLMTTLETIQTSGLKGPLIQEVTKVQSFLSDPDKVGICLVTLAMELVVKETIEFQEKLEKECQTQILSVICNRWIEQFGSETELDEIKNETLRHSIIHDRELRIQRQDKATESFKSSSLLPIYKVLDFGVVDKGFIAHFD